MGDNIAILTFLYHQMYALDLNGTIRLMPQGTPLCLRTSSDPTCRTPIGATEMRYGAGALCTRSADAGVDCMYVGNGDSLD
jgi:hypothetical protein